MPLHNAPRRQATPPTKRNVRIGAKPILWRGWAAGAIVSLCIWGLIAAAFILR